MKCSFIRTLDGDRFGRSYTSCHSYMRYLGSNNNNSDFVDDVHTFTLSSKHWSSLFYHLFICHSLRVVVSNMDHTLMNDWMRGNNEFERTRKWPKIKALPQHLSQ